MKIVQDFQLHSVMANPHRASSVASSEASDLCNGSETHLERQVKHHHRLALVTLPLTLDAPRDVRCGYTLRITQTHAHTRYSYSLCGPPLL